MLHNIRNALNWNPLKLIMQYRLIMSTPYYVKLMNYLVGNKIYLIAEIWTNSQYSILYDAF